MLERAPKLDAKATCTGNLVRPAVVGAAAIPYAAPQAAGCVADLVNTHAFATAVGLVLRASRARDPLEPLDNGATPWAGLVRGRLGVVARWLR